MRPSRSIWRSAAARGSARNLARGSARSGGDAGGRAEAVRKGRGEPRIGDLAAAPRALDETGARVAGLGAMWTLLEGLLQDHLDAPDDAGQCIADLLDGLLADLPRPFDGPGGSRRGRVLDIEANLLGARDGALDGVPRNGAEIAADLGRTLDEGARADADGVDRLGADLLRALENADHSSLGGGTDVAADLGRAHDGAAKDVGYRRRQRGTDRARTLDGGHQCAADGVDDSVQDLTGALDRADHLVFHRVHDSFAARIHLAHLEPPFPGMNSWSLPGGRPAPAPRGCRIKKTLHPGLEKETPTYRTAPSRLLSATASGVAACV